MRLEQFDWHLSRWMERHGHLVLRCGIALVFLWFGAPKLVPGLSPADELVARTLPWFDPVWLLPSLGLAEMGIGVCLLYRPWLRIGLVLMAGHMLGTALPLVTLPDVAWKVFPIATLEGQYILKNLVLVSGAIVLGGTNARILRRDPSVRWVARRVPQRTGKNEASQPPLRERQPPQPWASSASPPVTVQPAVFSASKIRGPYVP